MRISMEALDHYTRKLAAILFTDMVGYTAVMQQDEIKAILLQKRHQHTIDAFVKQYGGEVKNDMGDGSMSILPSAYAVIQCAMAIQTELKKEPRVNIRIGIHIADVLIEDSGKVHGDGINIASRIETLGVAGAILFSKEIYNKIKNHPEIKTVLVGSYPFKNVEEPMEVYAIANEGFSIPSPQEALAAGKLKKTAQPDQTKSAVSRMLPLLLLIPLILLSVYLFYPKTKPSTLDGMPPDSIRTDSLNDWRGCIVFHDDFKPVSDVIITINGGLAVDTTDARGNYHLRLPTSLNGLTVKVGLLKNGKLNTSNDIRLTHDNFDTLKFRRESHLK